MNPKMTPRHLFLAAITLAFVASGAIAQIPYTAPTRVDGGDPYSHIYRLPTTQQDPQVLSQNVGDTYVKGFSSVDVKHFLPAARNIVDADSVFGADQLSILKRSLSSDPNAWSRADCLTHHLHHKRVLFSNERVVGIYGLMIFKMKTSEFDALR